MLILVVCPCLIGMCVWKGGGGVFAYVCVYKQLL